MFGRKKNKESNDDGEKFNSTKSDVIEQGSEKIINSLAVFAKIDTPIYNLSEEKPNIVEYKANKETLCYTLSSRNVGDYFNIDYESLSKQKNPLVSKIIINKEKSHLLLKRKDYVVYGAPLEKYYSDENKKGDFFYMTILRTIGEEDNQVVSQVLNIDFSTSYHKLGSFYLKNGYFTRSIFEFITDKLGGDIANEIFEEIGLFDNQLEF